jgi:hypothetical protein
MNRRPVAVALFSLSLAAIAAGCTVEERVVVRERPPPRVEVVPSRPSHEHVWVAGRWERTGAGWVWVSGVWARR